MNNRQLEILGLLIMALSLVVIISFIGYNPSEEPGLSPSVLIENPMGIVGVYTAYFAIKLGLGYAVFLVPVLGLIWGWWIFTKKSITGLVRPSAYGIGVLLLASISLGWLETGFRDPEYLVYNYAGLTGGLVGQLLVDFIGLWGSFIVIGALWVVLARGYFEWNFSKPIEWIQSRFTDWKTTRSESKEVEAQELSKRKHTEDLMAKIDAQREEELAEEEEEELESPPGEVNEEIPDTLQEEAQKISTILQPTPPPEKSPESIMDEGEEKEQEVTLQTDTEGENIEVGEMVVEDEVQLDAIKERKTPKRQYQLPKSGLLTTPVRIDDGLSKDELIDRANFLTQSLATFGVEGKVVNVHPGPVITLFEVEPAEGVRVNKFVQLSDDLARVMEASRVRVIAPIPGKSSVGIEIPNRNPATVYFKSVINSEKFAGADSKLTLAIGKTTSGEIATLNLAKMPHLLIAGTTGSGKSVCLNTIINSILYQATPEEVKFIIIDPKKVEMTLYRSLDNYYLLGTEDIDEPIVTSTENAILALKALEKEMDRRYTILADAVVRNIDEYNERMKKKSEPIMPYIILVVDELADLMMMSAKDVEAPIARLAQLARAVGIHLVIATQRPSVDVITGVIKANFPARIAFQVATKIDSRTILDTMGAEKLIGRGDMLYLGTGSSEPIRMHNAFISLEEIEAIMDHVMKQPKADEFKLASVRESSVLDGDVEADLDDDMFKEAIRLVVTHQQGSISLIQRRLKVGYSRAARMIDQMEQIGVVGPFTGSKAREVLVDELYLQTLD